MGLSSDRSDLAFRNQIFVFITTDTCSRIAAEVFHIRCQRESRSPSRGIVIDGMHAHVTLTRHIAPTSGLMYLVCQRSVIRGSKLINTAVTWNPTVAAHQTPLLMHCHLNICLAETHIDRNRPPRCRESFFMQSERCGTIVDSPGRRVCRPKL